MLKFIKLFGATIAILSLFGTSVTAQGVNDFIVSNFEADYYLDRSDPQGQMRIVEDITVNFSANNHGIERALPEKYKGKELDLKVNSVSSKMDTPVQYTTRESNDNLVLRIGDPNRTVTGRQNYVIEYTVQNVMSFYNSHDELYWDINGDQWNQPFGPVTARIHLPEGLESNGENDCFTGGFGSNADHCLVSQDERVITAQTTSGLNSGETLTVVVGFEKGFFRPMTFKEKLLEMLPTISAVALPPLLIGGYAFRHWWKNGRDPKGRGTIVPEYDAPDSLKPAEVGTVADFRTDQREITATILDLAIRGYIKLIEEKKVKRFMPDSLEYSAELLKSDTKELKPYESVLLRGLFPKMTVGDKVEFKDLKNKYYVHVKSANTSIMDSLVKANYFKGKPATAGLRLWVMVAILFVAVSFIGALIGPAILVGLILASIPLFIFATAMPARTEKGVAAKEHALGLKMYMETAEADRIRMMQSPDAPYMRTAEPKKTVELYEKLLPFAVVFGVEKQWSEEFKNIYASEPGWYNGTSHAAFNSVYLANAIGGSMGTAMGASFASPSSSGSSGFGGGGFSGGGGGGGGGGGW